MTEEHAERYIRVEKRNTRSIEDQVEISHVLWRTNIGPNHDGQRPGEIEERNDLDLEYEIETSLGHLAEIDAIEGVRPDGPEFYVISQRLDEIINGRVDDVAAADTEAVIEHMQDDDPQGADEQEAIADGAGQTIRGAIADEFDLIPEGVEDYLRHGDQVEKLNVAIESIEDLERVDTRDDYGKIIFRKGATRYRLTEEHVERYEREEQDWE